ncbi:metallo-beta-lactamase family protein [Teratosphaeria destructans]|uniref:Metallo-beta-lactamase family protein n=1 Tax=Teratosphaeria destructans TaxID=418781 RepID=A0A9W7VZR8_9PEZI|nr:metallo-beta-lactamase family protein [Teratosphaeria destructans]
MPPPPTEDLLICVACGTQFDLPADSPPNGCRICDDPRQFVPPTGQAWTSLARMRGHHTNRWKPVGGADHEDALTSIWTEPKFAIGQRCILVETGAGNVLWDCITYLDDDTTAFINSRGGLAAIVISHPHYYTTHLLWADTFDCPVYLAQDDAPWLNTPDPARRRRFITTETAKILDPITAIKLGGHFPGSLVLHWTPPSDGGGGNNNKLLIADTFVTTPSALYHIDRPPGTTSYAFMWAIPNMIPLPPATLQQMWRRIRAFDFASTHGAFVGQDVRGEGVKGRVLESMKIQTRAMGWEGWEERWG